MMKDQTSGEAGACGKRYGSRQCRKKETAAEANFEAKSLPNGEVCANCEPRKRVKRLHSPAVILISAINASLSPSEKPP